AAQTQKPSTAEISGIVMLDGAGTPMRHAQVNLTAPELRGQRSVATDEKGHFSFVALPEGRYSLSATKPGYVSMAYGAKKPGRAGTPIQLGVGQKFDRTTIYLAKGSVITGVVVDEN